MTRIVHLALAEGRGHLVRAHRLASLLAPAGIEVEIATTRPEGAAFLRSLGSRSWVLPGGLRLAFDDRHAMDVPALRRGLLRYFAQGFAADIRALRARGADLYVNDSFHPALLTGDLDDVVLLHGNTMEQAMLAHFDDTPLAPLYRALLSDRLDRAHARVHHAFVPSSHAEGAIVLPPLLAPVVCTEPAVRRRIDAAPGKPIACVYLNPHFRDPAIATALERALADFHVHAIGEGYVDRPGWQASDPELHEVIARSALFVAGAGMAALAEARRARVPFLVVEGDQPEQARNLAAATRIFAPDTLARVAVVGRDLEALRIAFIRAIDALAIPTSSTVLRSTSSPQLLWRDTFVALVTHKRMENRPACQPASPSSSRPTTSAAARPQELPPPSRGSSFISEPAVPRSAA